MVGKFINAVTRAREKETKLGFFHFKSLSKFSSKNSLDTYQKFLPNTNRNRAADKRGEKMAISFLPRILFLSSQIKY
jgi:hypothetical protein